jgi:predicted DNA-binding protein
MPRQLISIEDQLTQKIQIRVTKDTELKLKKIAKKKLRSKSYVVCQAIDMYLKQLEDTENEARRKT